LIQTTEEFTKQRNGFKQPTTAKNSVPQTSLASSPGAIPTAVGRFFSIEIIVI
jgi:hypothetical protein